MIRIYFDASVIMAALISPSGGSAKLLQLTQNNFIIGLTSQTVIEEVEEHADKIKKNLEEIRRFIVQANLLVRERIVPSEIEELVGLIDPDDAHVLAGAKLTGARLLVSLDKKHLLSLKVQENFKPLKIVSPKEALEILIND